MILQGTLEQSSEPELLGGGQPGGGFSPSQPRWRGRRGAGGGGEGGGRGGAGPDAGAHDRVPGLPLPAAAVRRQDVELRVAHPLFYGPDVGAGIAENQA